MERCVVLLGPSRAGKDTAYVQIQQVLWKTCQIRFSAPMKRALEYLAVLPDGALETDHYRQNDIFPEVTGLDAMVKAFTHFRAISPEIMFPRTEKAIQEAIRKGQVPVITDLRTPEEVELLANMGLKPDVLRLHRADLVKLPSDRHLDDNCWALRSFARSMSDLINSDLAKFRSDVQVYARSLKDSYIEEEQAVKQGIPYEVIV